jgi:hypothetical protein
MSGVRGQLVKARIEKLRPTQGAVGYAEVALKRRQWRALRSEERHRFISERPFPAVLGPSADYFIVDGHHLGRALLEEGVDMVPLSLIEDFSHLEPTAFWQVMDRHGLIFPYDVNGRRQDFEKLPQTLRGLGDDPFRSLAARVRRAGGYPKDSTPFAEFRWADYFRCHISLAALNSFPELAAQCARKLVQHGTSICEKCDTALSGMCGRGQRAGAGDLSAQGDL